MVANFDKNFVIPKQSAAQLPVGKHERKRQILHIVAVRSALAMVAIACPGWLQVT